MTFSSKSGTDVVIHLFMCVCVCICMHNSINRNVKLFRHLNNKRSINCISIMNITLYISDYYFYHEAQCELLTNMPPPPSFAVFLFTFIDCIACIPCVLSDTHAAQMKLSSYHFCSAIVIINIAVALAKTKEGEETMTMGPGSGRAACYKFVLVYYTTAYG